MVGRKKNNRTKLRAENNPLTKNVVLVKRRQKDLKTFHVLAKFKFIYVFVTRVLISQTCFNSKALLKPVGMWCVRPTIRHVVGCINHDIVVGLCIQIAYVFDLTGIEPRTFQSLGCAITTGPGPIYIEIFLTF